MKVTRFNNTDFTFKIYNPKPYFNVCSPIGGFSNHVRWLLWLDPSIECWLTYTEEKYNIYAGPDWPTYENFVKQDFSGISNKIKIEIQNYIAANEIAKPLPLINTNDKISWIMENVYFDSRSWQNWLRTEWTFRFNADEFALLRHEVDDCLANECNTVVCEITPELAYRCYVKLNPIINQDTPSEFQSRVYKLNQKHKAVSRIKNFLFVNVDKLYSETLDPEIYDSMIQYLGLENFYDQAQLVHKKWYQLHRQAENDFLNYIINLYGNPNNATR